MTLFLLSAMSSVVIILFVSVILSTDLQLVAVDVTRQDKDSTFLAGILLAGRFLNLVELEIHHKYWRSCCLVFPDGLL